MRGGLDKILRMVWRTIIDDFDSIEPFLAYVDDSSEEDCTTFKNLFGPNVTPEDFVNNFLSGSGIPCEAEWTTITGGGRLQDIPSSEMLEKPSFRPRMLTWAMTGVPHLPRAADTLQVSVSLMPYPFS